MEYKKKDLEKLILHNYTPKKNRSVEEVILLTGHKWVLATVTLLAIYNVMMYVYLRVGFEYENFVRMLFTNAIIFILMPVVVIGTICWMKRLLRKHADAINHESNKASIVAIITPIAALGVIFGRVFLSEVSLSTASIILSIAALFLTLIFVMCTTITYYKVYLIKKYCPHYRKKR